MAWTMLIVLLLNLATTVGNFVTKFNFVVRILFLDMTLMWFGKCRVYVA